MELYGLCVSSGRVRALQEKGRKKSYYYRRSKTASRSCCEEAIGFLEKGAVRGGKTFPHEFLVQLLQRRCLSL